MSTLKVSAIEHPSATSAAFTFHSDGTVTLGPSVNLGGFASGTLMLFVQTTAPTGWTKSTTHNDKTLRVVSGAAGSGGTTAFTSVFASRTPSGSVSGSNSGGSVSDTTLSTSQIPSHRHGLGIRNGAANLGYTSSADAFGQTGGGGTNLYSSLAGYTSNTNIISLTGGGGSHGHGFTTPSWSGSFTGTAMDFAVQYVDVIIATKD